MSVGFGNRRVIGLLVTALAVVVGMLTVTSPAQAAVPDAPSNLTATFPATSSDLPVLSWDRVADATSYDLQLSSSSAFTTLIGSSLNTVNLHGTPSVQIPVGTVWYRVRSKNTAGTSNWSTSTFERTAVDAPVPSKPSPGEVLQQPDAPALFAWSPVGGITKYELQISTDSAFTDPALITSYNALSNSLVLPSLQVPTTTYWWRVRGQLGTGIYTVWSAPSSYYVSGLAPAQVVAPNNDVNQSVEDAVLAWTAVPGAATYDLQISTDSNFLTVVHSVTGVTGTSYARPQTLNNDQYYWRVRPVDASGNKLDWSQVPVWQFRRNWPQQPQLEYPAPDATVGDPFYFQWSPVKLASFYTVEFSDNITFSTGVHTCTTVHTTLTGCFPAAWGTYYWRVTATDLFTNNTVGPTTDEISSEVQRFTYGPSMVQLTSPANGAEVSVPTMRWNPVAGAAKYKVTVTGSDGSDTTITTAALSFTPRGQLDAGTTYRWQVQTVSEDGRLGAGVLPLGQRTFNLVDQDAPTASLPQPTGPSGEVYPRFPTLTWKPVVGATEYAVRIRKAGAVAWSRLNPTFDYPAGEDDGVGNLAPGDYQWYVEAYNAGALISQSSLLGTFTIATPGAVTGYKAALTGSTLDTDSCQATLPAECQNLRQTPVLSWDADPNQGYYMLYISRDKEMTNLVQVSTAYTNMSMNVATLPDSQAGSAYFWYVRPCTAGGQCGPLEHATHSFNKQSAKVRLTGPANGATVQDAVTLSWQDYLDSQSNAENAVGTPLTTPARIEARRYKVQTATDENFQNIIESIDVDQASFTSYLKTYPEGPIYWRVQAIDGSNNPLTWSDTGSFVKVSPAPVPTSPAPGATVSGGEPLAWQPLAFAASYDIEVYKNDDTVPSPANLVVTANSKQVAYSLATPLPVSDQSYRWRVRRVDSTGRKGSWSALTPFQVVGQTPTLTSPGDGVRLSPTDSLFVWEPLATATSYRFERRLVGSSDIAETVTTPSVAWAPKIALTTGSWEWRVTALDAASKPLGTSAWRGFTVISTPTAESGPVVTGSGKIGTSLTSTEVGWNLPDVTTTYQWFRGSSPIPDETGLVYLLTTADLGKSISVKATGTKLGYTTGTAASNAIIGATGDAPLLLEEVVLEGTGQVGSMLSIPTPEWNQTGVTTTYQWLRAGVAISGARSDSYTVTSGDVGKALSLRVTGAKSGYTSGVVVSNSVQGSMADPLEYISAPEVTGTGKVGLTLTADPGTWPAGTKITYQWLRGGVIVTGATRSTYKLTPADAGRALSARITATKTGYGTGVATTASIAVAKLTSKAAGRLASTKIAANQRGSYTVTLTVSGVSAPAGSVSILVGTKVVKTIKLTAAARGKVSLVLPKLAKGRHLISAKYAGTVGIIGCKAPPIALTVTK